MLLKKNGRTMMVEFIMAGWLGRRRKKVQYTSYRVKWKKWIILLLSPFSCLLSCSLPSHVTTVERRKMKQKNDMLNLSWTIRN